MKSNTEKQIERIGLAIDRCGDPELNSEVDLSHLVPGLKTELAEAQARLRISTNERR